MPLQLEENRQRVEETHSSLTDKLETIEHDVREMIQAPTRPCPTRSRASRRWSLVPRRQPRIRCMRPSNRCSTPWTFHVR